MGTVLLQEELNQEQLRSLQKEFPQFQFIFYPLESEVEMPFEVWFHTEILYGSRLACEQLTIAQKLRWVHVPNANLHHICFPEIVQKGNVVVTIGSEESVQQVAEYVIGVILAYGKELFHWHERKSTPENFWEITEQEKIWGLKNKTLLQIGLGKVGSEIARRAQQMNLKVTGAQPHRSFHPHCQKTVTFFEIDTVLPDADIVCVALPRNEETENLLGARELKLLKNDAILIIIGSYNVVNENALATIAKQGRCRGIFLDVTAYPPLPVNSPLWKAPITITPEIATRPHDSTQEQFQTFHFNFRQYLAGNLNNMRNRIDRG